MTVVLPDEQNQNKGKSELANINYEAFAEIVKALRGRLPGNPSQAKIAKKATIATSTLGKVETATGQLPTYPGFINLADALQVDVGDLMRLLAGQITLEDVLAKEKPTTPKHLIALIETCTEEQIRHLSDLIALEIQYIKNLEKLMPRHPNLKALAQIYNETGQLPDQQQQQQTSTNQLPAGNAVPAPTAKPAKGKASTTNNNGNGKKTS